MSATKHSVLVLHACNPHHQQHKEYYDRRWASYGFHMDSSGLEMWLVLKDSKNVWNSETINSIINNEEEDIPTPATGNKRQHDDEDDDG